MNRFLLLIGCAVFATTLQAEGRLPTINPLGYTEEQRQAAEAFEQARKVPVFGPFEPLMHSPEVMTLARSMGDYLRYHSALGNTLSEWVILITAREWSQDYEWFVHYPIALKAGIKPELANAIRDGRRPAGMSADEEMLYDFCMELHHHRQVSDATFAKVRDRFGTKGVVDLVGINGYYTFLAMQMNVARYPIPREASPLPRFPE
jgi:4-carboxymuconolactone decarboxylase